MAYTPMRLDPRHLEKAARAAYDAHPRIFGSIPSGLWEELGQDLREKIISLHRVAIEAFLRAWL